MLAGDVLAALTQLYEVRAAQDTLERDLTRADRSSAGSWFVRRGRAEAARTRPICRARPPPEDPARAPASRRRDHGPSVNGRAGAAGRPVGCFVPVPARPLEEGARPGTSCRCQAMGLVPAILTVTQGRCGRAVLLSDDDLVEEEDSAGEGTACCEGGGRGILLGAVGQDTGSGGDEDAEHQDDRAAQAQQRPLSAGALRRMSARRVLLAGGGLRHRAPWVIRCRVAGRGLLSGAVAGGAAWVAHGARSEGCVHEVLRLLGGSACRRRSMKV